MTNAPDPTPVVIIHYGEHGELNYHVSGDAVRVYIVDERARHDRVFELTRRVGPDDIRAIIPEGSEIGSAQDARHAAIANTVRAEWAGRARFSVVGQTEDNVAPFPAADR